MSITTIAELKRWVLTLKALEETTDLLTAKKELETTHQNEPKLVLSLVGLEQAIYVGLALPFTHSNSHPTAKAIRDAERQGTTLPIEVACNTNVTAFLKDQLENMDPIDIMSPPIFASDFMKSIINYRHQIIAHADGERAKFWFDDNNKLRTNPRFLMIYKEGIFEVMQLICNHLINALNTEINDFISTYNGNLADDI